MKFKKIVSCSSEHPSYPASNLLENPPAGPWKCSRPGEMSATVTFELPESSLIAGLDIGNYRSCLVVVSASTSQDPSNWEFILNHQFMTRDEAANNKFKNQVQMFTKNELNPDTIDRKFNKVKFTCLQSANLKELFGLSFIILRTEERQMSDLRIENFEVKSWFSFEEKPIQVLSDEEKKDEEIGSNTRKIEKEKRAWGKERDIFISNDFNSNNGINYKNKRLSDSAKAFNDDELNEASTSNSDRSKLKTKNSKCFICSRNPSEFCKMCKKLPAPIFINTAGKKAKTKVRKEFPRLLSDVKFSLSGYVNPQRDEIRKKALKMGAKYIADPNTTSNKCTHLVCAFKNTPKYQQLRGHAKIISHIFIDECFDHKKRYPWRRYALSNNDRRTVESEEEVEASSTSPARPGNFYDQDTDSDTNYGDY